MNDCCSFGSFRGYSNLLLEEVALEGLEGITLEILKKRLEVNPEWHLKPIDDVVEELILKQLIKLDDVQWFALDKPRECPLIFTSTEEYLDALEKNVVNVNTLSSTIYPHNLINDGKVLGSCSTFHTRREVTEEIQLLNLSEIKIKWGNKLVVVASQRVRNYVLFPCRMNPDHELLDLMYCILERIGRSRRVGELSMSLTFLKNGPNPTFYFWNKLRRWNIVKSQAVTVFGKFSHCTLFHLPRFYRLLENEFFTTVRTIVEKIKATPHKRVLYSEIKEKYFPSKRLRSDFFRRQLKCLYVPYKEFYPESDQSLWNTTNGGEKLIKVLKLANDNPSDESEEEEDKNERILDGDRLFNRPLLAQCYDMINESSTDGITMVELGKELGLNKLIIRQLLNYLLKTEVILRTSSEDARVRYYRYYSANYKEEVKSKFHEQVGKLDRILDISSGGVTSETLPILKSSSSASNEITEFENEVAVANIGKNVSAMQTRKRSAIEKSSRGRPKKIKLESSTAIPETANRTEKADSIEKIPYTKHIVPMKESIFVMRRVNIILEYLYKNEVVLKSNLTKNIIKEETARGIFQGVPDRKSLRKVVDILINSGKAVIMKKIVSDEIRKKSREIEFLCVTNVDENHPVIQSTIQEVKRNLSILYVKNGSRIKAKALVSPFPPSGRKTGKYGCAPKFSRMKILHELLVYLLYQYEGDENLDQEERRVYLQPLMDSSEQLPRCYVKEIGWKMFIPPLLKYEEYGDGWISPNDLVDRLPLKLFFNLIRLPFDNPEVESYLHHPIKQYYLMHDLPLSLQNYMKMDKTYLYLLILTLRNLCTIGLTQFGPKTPIRGQQSLIYLNKRTQLMDTRMCPPSYMYINPKIQYPTYYYEFTYPKAMETYWNEALRFSIGTKLGRKKSFPRQKQSRETPARLVSSYQERSLEEAVSRDTGDVPGDRLGAAGYDSSLFAHMMKQWLINSAKEYKTSSTKSSKNVALKPISKLKRFRNYTIRKPATKRNRSHRGPYDKVDVEALKKMRTLRSRWTKDEDELLIMCYAAGQYYVHPAFSRYRPYTLYRKLLHNTSEKSADKTSEACKRRLANIKKNSLQGRSVSLFIKEMREDVALKNKFQFIIDQIQKYDNTKRVPAVKELLDKLTEEVFHYLNHFKKVPILSERTCDVMLPDDIDTFRKTYDLEYAISHGNEKPILPLNNEKDAVILSFTNLILSTLLSQVDSKKILNANFLYQVFRQFNDTLSKAAYSYLRNNRLISYNRCSERQHPCFIPFGKGVYHLSITYHLIFKSTLNTSIFAQVYSKYLEILDKKSAKNVEINCFDGGFNLLLISYLIFKKISLEISHPDPLLLYNGDSLPLVAPEAIEKPSFIAKEKHTDKTLSVICESYFKNVSKSEDGIKVEELENNNDDEEPVLSDPESCADEAEDEEDKSIDYTVSKISLFVTRNHIKINEVRFTNTYDLFRINTFPMAYSVSANHLFDRNPGNWTGDLEEIVKFTKIKFTSDELMLKIRKFLREPRQRDCAVNVMEFLRSKGKCGATYEMLRNEFSNLQLLKKVLDTMYRKKLLIRSGAEYTHFIHLNYAEHWLIRSYSNKNTNLFHEKNDADSEETLAITRSSCDEFEQKNSSDQIWIYIKPWICIDGTINVKALESFLIRILGFITKNPGSSLKRIQKHFVPALQPYFTRELVELLQQLTCVQLFVFTVNHKVSLFSEPQEYSLSESATGLEDENDILVEPDVNALVKFSCILMHVNYKDLLETKYSADVSRINEKSEKDEKYSITEKLKDEFEESSMLD